MKEKKKFGLFKEFIAFIQKGNALALAIGVIIGGAFSSIVSSINKDIIMPFIGALLGGQDFKGIRTPLWNAVEVLDANGVVQYDEYGQVVYSSAIYWGRFIQAVIDFILIALVLFIIMKITTAVAKRIQKTTEALLKKKEKEAEVLERTPIVEEKVIEPSNEEKLLVEIRDLLKERNSK